MDSTPFNLLDLAAAAILLISAVLAFFRGFVHEVLAITAWVGAVLAALNGLPFVRDKARELIPITWAADAAAAAVLFLGSLIVLALITRSISKRVQESALNGLDRSLGFLFGIVRGAFVVAVAYIVLSWVWPGDDERPAWIAEARSLPLMEAGADMVRALVPAELLSEEDRIKATAEDAQRKARQAIEAKKIYDRLAQPRPEAGRDGVEEQTSQPAYDADERRDLDRLFETNQ